jgi:hypothetical protein
MKFERVESLQQTAEGAGAGCEKQPHGEPLFRAIGKIDRVIICLPRRQMVPSVAGRK